MPSLLTHLLVATTEDSATVRGLTGALERRVERVTVFRPGPPARRPVALATQWWLGKTRYPLEMTVAALKQTAQELREAAARVRPEAVLSVGGACVAYLERREVERPEALKVPIFLFDEAPWLAKRRAYERWQPMPAWGRRFAEDEARAARQLDGLCFGSAWACGEALRIYSQSGTRQDLALTERLHPVSVGAGRTPSMGREELVAHRRAMAGGEVLELLFLGPDDERGWERGGGVIAVEIARQMQMAGRRVRLHLAGRLQQMRLPESMTGFLVLHGEETPVEELLLKAHFVLAPALAECSGAGFAQAQAFALPVVARAVDAVPCFVQDGVTGMLLPAGARASAYVERVLALWDDREGYVAMAERARARYEAEWNWDRTAEEIVRAIERRMQYNLSEADREDGRHPMTLPFA